MKNLLIIIPVFLSLLISCYQVRAQVGINNNNPDPSSILDLKHDSKGLLIPRMEEIGRRSINNPAYGLLVYDTFYDMVFMFTGRNKVNLQSSWLGLNPWRFKDTVVDPLRHVYLDAKAANVGIGTMTPRSRLTVVGNLSVGKDEAAPVNGMYVEGNVNVNASITAKDTIEAYKLKGYGTIPIGGIIMWSGTTVPDGWALCDGTPKDGMQTPNLSGRFIVASGKSDDWPTNYIINTTGGEETHTLTINEMPSHDHNGATGAAGAHSHTLSGSYEEIDADGDGGNDGFTNSGSTSTSTAPNHTHTIPAQGGGAAHENRPPYYVLAFIMRTK